MQARARRPGERVSSSTRKAAQPRCFLSCCRSFGRGRGLSFPKRARPRRSASASPPWRTVRRPRSRVLLVLQRPSSRPRRRPCRRPQPRRPTSTSAASTSSAPVPPRAMSSAFITLGRPGSRPRAPGRRARPRGGGALRSTPGGCSRRARPRRRAAAVGRRRRASPRRVRRLEDASFTTAAVRATCSPASEPRTSKRFPGWGARARGQGLRAAGPVLARSPRPPPDRRRHRAGPC